MYEVKNGIIYGNDGIPEAPRWFADSSLVFKYDKKGVGEIDFFSTDRGKVGCNVLFLENVFGGLVCYVQKNGKRFLPSYKNCKIYPFGIVCEFIIEGVTFQHMVCAVKNKLLFSLDVPIGTENATFDLEFYDSFRFTPNKCGNLPYRDSKSCREWGELIKIGDVVSFDFTEVSEEERYCSKVNIGAGSSCEFSKRGSRESVKNIFSTNIRGGQYFYVMSFGNDLPKSAGDLGRQFLRYKKVSDKSPILDCDNKWLNQLFSLVPMYHESLKIHEYHGAVRAKTTNYWTWGWDTLTYPYAVAYMGDIDFSINSLEFFSKHNVSDKGISMRYNQDMSVLSEFSRPTNAIYIIVLQMVFFHTGDKSILLKYYPTAKKFFYAIMEKYTDLGYVEGYSMFPDYPEFMHENGEDISAFNATVYYSAFRSMEYLACFLGDIKTLKALREIIKKQEKSFLNLFYNEDKGFVVSSIHSKTLKPRLVYNINNVKLENCYLLEMLEPIIENNLNFFEREIICSSGLRCMPENAEQYDGDGNQFHYWFPVTEGYFVRICNLLGRGDLLKKWAGWVSHWSSHLMCPEGINTYADTNTPLTDGWTTLPGTFQEFTMRPWYQDLIESYVGINMEDGQLTFFPTDIGDAELKNIHLRSGVVADISIKGSGRYLEYVQVNGEKIYNTNKIPGKMLDSYNRIKAIRTNIKPEFCLLSAYGAELTEFNKNKISLLGAGTVRVRILSCRPLETNGVGEYKNEIMTYTLVFDKYEEKTLLLEK